MKKIICARCGAVNLEGFITYPHCAGCSALLVETAPKRVMWWTRRLRVVWWFSVLGGALAFLVALAFLETRDRDGGQILVYPRVPRRVNVGADFVARYQIDVVSEKIGAAVMLRDLELRLPRHFERDWQIVKVDPPPAADSGATSVASTSGRTFRYDEWPLQQTWRLRLRARRVGDAKIILWATGENHLAVQTRSTVTVLSDKAKP